MSLDEVLALLGDNAPDPDDSWERGKWIAPNSPERASLAEDFNWSSASLGCAGEETLSLSAEDSAAALQTNEWVWLTSFSASVWWDFLPDEQRKAWVTD